jgi:hypothetical protein
VSWPLDKNWQGHDRLLNLKNKPTEDFLTFLKNKDGGLRSNVQNRPNLTPQITLQLVIWIPFFRFNFWTYYLTLETCLRWSKLNFDKILLKKSHHTTRNEPVFFFIAKSKMAAAATITKNCKIGRTVTWKVCKRGTHFF